MSKWYKGYIRWFDNLSGIGYVTVPELERDIKIHYSASAEMDLFKNKSWDNRKSSGGRWITYENLDIVEVQIIQDYGWEQVTKCRPSNWITKEDLLSDSLINFLESSNECRYEWDHFILNNIISAIEITHWSET